MHRAAAAALSVAVISASGWTPAFAQVNSTTFRPEVRYAQVGDVKLAYYTRGSGAPLLMVNGFISTMSLWDPALLAELEKEHTLILFDNRGVGLSTDTKENHTTIEQMADDAAGLAKALGYSRINILGWSMGARITQQVLIRHPDLVSKGVLASANPGGTCQVKTSNQVETELNNPNVPLSDKVALTFPDNPKGKQAEAQVLARIKAAVKAGTIPDDFKTSKQTTERQDRARTTLWSGSNANCEALSGIKIPVLLTDGRDDVVDIPRNSLVIANKIPFSWLAFFEGGHSFLFQSYQKFSEVVNTFLK